MVSGTVPGGRQRQRQHQHQRLWRRLLKFGGAALIAGGLAAMMPPWVYEEARKEAAHHVQVEITGYDDGYTGYGDCAVDGRVVTVFRGPLEVGDEVYFTVPVIESGQPPVGGTIWRSYGQLRDADFVEIYANGEGPSLRLAEDQMSFISGPSTTPRCPEIIEGGFLCP